MSGVVGEADGKVAEAAAAVLLEQWQRHVDAAGDLRAVLPTVAEVATQLIDRYRRGGILYTFGNGGSAADAQHLAGEMIGRYLRERRPLPAVALSTDPSVTTCIANDYGYDDVFARQVSALARADDMVIGFSTSGTSPSVVDGLAAARSAGALTALFTGSRADRSALGAAVDILVVAPVPETARVQEMHLLMLHMISDIVDRWAVETDPAPVSTSDQRQPTQPAVDQAVTAVATDGSEPIEPTEQ